MTTSKVVQKKADPKVTVQLYTWSDKGKRRLNKEGAAELLENYFICVDGKFLAEVDGKNNVIAVGQWMCASRRPDSYHIPITKPLAKIRLNREDFRSDLEIESRLNLKRQGKPVGTLGIDLDLLAQVLKKGI